MKGPERVETTRLVLRRPSMADAEATTRGIPATQNYQVCWLAKASIHRRNPGIPSLQRSGMEPMACGALLDRVPGRPKAVWFDGIHFRIANRRGNRVHTRSRCLRTRIRARSANRDGRCGRPTGSPAIVRALSSEPSGVYPRFREMRLCV